MVFAIMSCKEKDKNVAVTGVTLNPKTATLTISNDLTLTATVLPNDATNQAVTWQSSNIAIASVDNGKITALSMGTANIIVTTADGNKTDTCVVTVEGVLGIASFATESMWIVGSQTWSDAVQTTFCSNKTTYNGGSTSAGFNIDCRSNPDQKGDLFSWRAVNELKDQLCVAPWRVPTAEDFKNLDIAMEGSGENRTGDLEFINSKYLDPSVWGGVFGGFSAGNGSLANQGSGAYYWSLSEISATHANILGLGTWGGGTINVQHNNGKQFGFTLRCIKDN